MSIEHEGTLKLGLLVDVRTQFTALELNMPYRREAWCNTNPICHSDLVVEHSSQIFRMRVVLAAAGRRRRDYGRQWHPGKLARRLYTNKSSWRRPIGQIEHQQPGNCRSKHNGLLSV